ncbi:ABATE domain-containing protein [Pendulispora brunnea]|uniref:ABATE domain-containing protein n=1 Tax=Pendulispora brunnea TaxID=2905690 RepID=A0ABZ2K8G5_9BACT
MRKKSSKDWNWDGGRLSLDFINTVRDRKTGDRELLVDPADLAEWLVQTKLLDAEPDVSMRQLARAQALREAIDRLAVGFGGGNIEAADVDLLNECARVRPSAPELILGRGGSLEVRSAREKDPVGVALGKIAVDAIELLTAPRGMFRICAADDCGLRFEDRSPSRNRQWCSMKVCGNREKARLHYQRQK